MEVDVQLHGIVRPGSQGRAGDSFSLELAGDVCTRDLLGVLAERCGDPFRRALGSSDARLPRHIRMFVDGEMLVNLDQPLRSVSKNGTPNGSAPGVTVVVLSPMMGG